MLLSQSKPLHISEEDLPSTMNSIMNNFETLVDSLRNRLGPTSGINDDDVDPEELQTLMADYVSNEVEWKKYAFELSSVPYTRNLVDKGNTAFKPLVASGFRFHPVQYLLLRQTRVGSFLDVCPWPFFVASTPIVSRKEREY